MGAKRKKRRKGFQRTVPKHQVYFIRCLTTGLVKIGVSLNAKRRFYDLQHMSPTGLRLVRTLRQQPRELETFLHHHFVESRHHGEWFTPTPLLEHIIGAPLELVHDVFRAWPMCSHEAIITWLLALPGPPKRSPNSALYLDAA